MADHYQFVIKREDLDNKAGEIVERLFSQETKKKKSPYYLEALEFLEGLIRDLRDPKNYRDIIDLPGVPQLVVLPALETREPETELKRLLGDLDIIYTQIYH